MSYVINELVYRFYASSGWVIIGRIRACDGTKVKILWFDTNQHVRYDTRDIYPLDRIYTFSIDRYQELYELLAE